MHSDYKIERKRKGGNAKGRKNERTHETKCLGCIQEIVRLSFKNGSLIGITNPENHLNSTTLKTISLHTTL